MSRTLGRSLEDIKKGHYDWELQRRPDTGEREHWVTVAVELTARGNLSVKDIKGWIAAIEKLEPMPLIPLFEKGRLAQEVTGTETDWRMTLQIARRHLPDLVPPAPSAFSVTFLAVGEPFVPGVFTYPVNNPTTPVPKTAQQERPAENAPEGTDTMPLVGIIDDGIAFLNRRFCQRSDSGFTSRFRAIWLQSESTEIGGISTGVPFGTVMENAEVTSWLQSGRSEAEIYSLLNASLYPAPSQQATNTRLAHGTHVLDLAAGEDPALGGAPLIAVQLAPGTAWGTSGRRLEVFLVMGLRWMVARAVTENRDLVVNISLGTLAGPGDATNFIADAIASEIAAFHRLTERRMRVVIAYGNSWRANLVAEFLRNDKPSTRTIDWRILPDGYSSSYLELRVEPGAEVKVEVIPPGGPRPELTWTFGSKAKTDPVKAPAGGPIAQLLPLPDEPGASALLVAVAPTASLLPGDIGLAPAGAWTVQVTRTAQSPSAVTLRVQRNDTPVGYRVYGRQSYLADPAVSAWDDETRDYTLPDRNAAVQRAGTANSYAGLVDPAGDEDPAEVYYVGAVRPDSANAHGGMRASPYSSEGLDDKSARLRALNIASKGPTLAAQADDGRFFAGRRATGVASGPQSHRLSGTSIAAGLVTRRVAMFLSGALTGKTEREAVLDQEPAPSRDTRVGFGVVPGCEIGTGP